MSINICIDLEVDEIVGNSDTWSKRELLRGLLKRMSNDDINEIVNNLNNDKIKSELARYTSPGGSRTIQEDMFQTKLLSISKNYISITKEEEEIIANIARRF